MEMTYSQAQKSRRGLISPLTLTKLALVPLGLILAFVCIAKPSWADALDCSTRSNIVAGNTATASDVKTCMDNIVTWSTAITDTNIKSGAAIAAAKISGTALTLSGTQTVTGDKTFNGDLDFGDAATDTITITSAIDSNLVFEGATADAFETTFSITDPTADRTLTMPDADVNLTGGLGAILQVVNTITGAVATGTTTIPVDDTIPQNTEGDEYMTLAVTPANTNNKLIIDVVVNGQSSASGENWVAALYQDSTANALAAVYRASSGVGVATFRHYMTAGTASETTFKVRAGPNSAGTFTFNGDGGARIFGGVQPSSITITEIRV